MNLKDLGKGLLDKIDTDRIGEGLGRLAVKINKASDVVGEKLEVFAEGAQELGDKVDRVLSDIGEKAYETMEQGKAAWINKGIYGTKVYKEALKTFLEEQLIKISKIYSKNFVDVIENFYNMELNNKLYINGDEFVVINANLFAQASYECNSKEEIEIFITRKIALILNTAALKDTMDPAKYSTEIESIVRANKNQADIKMAEMNIKGYEDALGQLNYYQIEVAILESKYIGVTKYSDTLFPFFDYLINLYSNEKGYMEEMPFKNIEKAFELGVLENEDYMSILRDKQACLDYIKRFEKGQECDEEHVEELPIEETVKVVSNDKNESLDANKSVKHIVKIYNDYYEMESFFKNYYKNNASYIACSLKDESGQPEANSEYLIHSKSGNMITYYQAGAFADKMQNVINNQATPIVMCSKELLDKHTTTNILIVKCKGYYCNLPTFGGIYQYHQDSDLFTMTLADGSTISINPLTSDVVKYSEESEIMIDILRQISENQEKTLKQF